jgi:hypothetical protein
MNRSQAIERVDEILDQFAEMYVSGRCPRCETLLFDEGDGERPHQTAAAREVVHAGWCEVPGLPDEVARLSRRYAIPLEPVVVTVPGSNTWVIGVRRGVERPAGDRRAPTEVWRRSPLI